MEIMDGLLAIITIISFILGLLAYVGQKRADKRQRIRDEYNLFHDKIYRLASPVDKTLMEDNTKKNAVEILECIVDFIKTVGEYLYPLGLTEATNANKQRYVNSRLRSLLGVIELSNKIRNRLLEFNKQSNYLLTIPAGEQLEIIYFLLDYSELSNYLKHYKSINESLSREELNHAVHEINKILHDDNFIKILKKYAYFYDVVFMQLSKFISLNTDSLTEDITNGD